VGSPRDPTDYRREKIRGGGKRRGSAWDPWGGNAMTKAMINCLRGLAWEGTVKKTPGKKGGARSPPKLLEPGVLKRYEGEEDSKTATLSPR